MCSVIWSLPALTDIRAIDDWLTREAAPAFAVRTLATIRQRARFLEDFPHGGRPYKDGTRILRVYDTPYLIRYRLAKSRAEVLRIHHERENWFVEP